MKATFALEPPTLERFHLAVLRRHGKLHGHLAREVGQALDLHAARLEQEVRHG